MPPAMSTDDNIRRLQAQNSRINDRLIKSEVENEALKSELAALQTKLTATEAAAALFGDEDHDEQDSSSLSNPITDSSSSTASSSSSSRFSTHPSPSQQRPETTTTIPAPSPEQHQRLLWVMEGLLDVILKRIENGDTIVLPSFGFTQIEGQQQGGEEVGVTREGLIGMYRAALDPTHTANTIATMPPVTTSTPVTVAAAARADKEEAVSQRPALNPTAATAVAAATPPSCAGSSSVSVEDQQNHHSIDCNDEEDEEETLDGAVCQILDDLVDGSELGSVASDQIMTRPQTPPPPAPRRAESITGDSIVKRKSPRVVSVVPPAIGSVKTLTATAAPFIPQALPLPPQQKAVPLAVPSKKAGKKLRKLMLINEFVARVNQDTTDIVAWDQLSNAVIKTPFEVQGTTFYGTTMCMGQAALLDPTKASRWESLALALATTTTGCVHVFGTKLNRTMAEVKCIELGGATHAGCSQHWTYLGNSLAMSETVIVKGKEMTRMDCFKMALELNQTNAIAWLGLAELLPKGETFTLNGTTFDNFGAYAAALSYDGTLSTAWFHLSMILPDTGCVVILGRSVSKSQCKINYESLRYRSQNQRGQLSAAVLLKQQKKAARKLLKARTALQSA